jgi:transcription antitermination factor NusG
MGYFLRNKYEVFGKFKEFKALVENQMEENNYRGWIMVESSMEMISRNFVKSAE